MAPPLAGKVAVVLGGTRGIGGAISTRLAEQGAPLAMIYQSRGEDAARLAAALPSAIAIQADVADPRALEAAIGEAAAHYGGLDILVCNAGLTITRPLAELTEEDYDRVYAVNVKASFLALRAAALTMRDGGRVVAIGSIVAQTFSGPGGTLYASSKAALGGMVRAAARDLAPRGITVNLIQPGPIATDRNPPGSTRADPAMLPLALKRMGTADEVAALASFLISPDASYITGATYNVDGGWTA